MPHALMNRLERRFRLSREDRVALEAAAGRRVRRAGPHQDIVQEGDAVGDILLILSGWGCCYKALRDGRRQITSILLPGDLAELDAQAGAAIDYSIGALSPVTYAEIPRDVLNTLVAERPRLVRALRWVSLTQMATQREWALNVGQRTAFERIAHLLCEIYLRMAAAGRAFHDSCEFPITQIDIGNATGLTSVYVNRTLKKLRALGLIVLKGGELHISDIENLKRAGLFSPEYLQLETADHENKQPPASTISDPPTSTHAPGWPLASCGHRK